MEILHYKIGCVWKITFDKYYMAVIDEKSVSFITDLNKHRRFKRQFFETKQERLKYF